MQEEMSKELWKRGKDVKREREVKKKNMCMEKKRKRKRNGKKDMKRDESSEG